MALFEFYCDSCKHRFERIVSSTEDPKEAGRCPQCDGAQTRKLISAFRVGGQGDLRETTMHGCHDCNVGPPGSDGHSHDHGHGHDHED